MDSENSSIPPSATGQKPDTSAGSLYAQITAEDVDPAAQPKKHKASLFIQGAVRLMQLTFYFDSLKRTHESVFIALSALWAVFMSCLYLGGALTLLFGVYHVMQLPLVIESQLRDRGLEFEKIQLVDYSLNRIEITNVRDKKYRYQVSKIIINSTFADFLRKRIRSVTLDELTVNMVSKNGQTLFGELPAILYELKHPTRGSLGLTIDGININNAVLNFNEGKTSLPISFQVAGVYSDKTEVAIRFNIKQENFSLAANFFNSTNKPSEWTLSIQNGSITLPKRSPQDLAGTVRFKISDEAIDSVDMDLKLLYGSLEKKITGTLTRTSEAGMNASLVLLENNLNEPALSNQMRVSFGELVLNNGGVESHRPIQISVQSFANAVMKIREMHTVVNGDLVCPNWYACTFSLKEQTSIAMQESQWTYFGKTAHGTENALTLLPSDDTVYFSFYDPYLKLNLKVANLNFIGHLDAEDDLLSVQALSADVHGYFTAAQGDSSRLGFTAKGVNLTMNKLRFVDGDISVSDVLNPSREVQLMARQVRYETLPVLTVPFDVKMAMVGRQATIRIQPGNSDLIMALDGQFSPFQSAFAGTIKIPEFDLAKTKSPLGTLSSGLMSNISDVSGKMAVAGRLVWKGANSMTGPLTIAAKDVSFKWGDTYVRDLNTVLEVTSLVPFVTPSNQRVFIGSIDSLVPFSSTQTSLQFENQTLRLMGLTTHVAGVEMTMPASVVPMRNPNIVLFLKNTNPIDLAKVYGAMNMPQAAVLQGTGALTIPVEIQENKVGIPSLTFKITNATLVNRQNSWPNVFEGERNYIIRTGQISVNQKREMHISLDGRLSPSRNKKVVELKKVTLPATVFKKTAPTMPPRSIANAQKTFFAQ